jgi:glucosamine-6-phosphate deaminase
MNKLNYFSEVEKKFIKNQDTNHLSTNLPYIIVKNFPTLGLLSSLRFLEWVQENPEGIISLPTGKTPEHFIKWTKYILENWEKYEIKNLCEKYGLSTHKKPNLSKLHFVQMDEFFPIDSKQKNSFAWYVQQFYIKGFGLNLQNAMLIETEKIPLYKGKNFYEIFPELKVDLSLRNRKAKTLLEQRQQESIYKIDDWCSDYEQKIRDKGGIGFFLGGIGPDGHIAFNTKGSSHFSTTRLKEINFETQAVAASDLGGIEISRNKLVITIGLETIKYNKNAVAIIIAAGEAKADIVKKSLESIPSSLYPASALKKMKNAKFYLTKGAASKLNSEIEKYYKNDNWTFEKTQRAIIDLCIKENTYAHNLTIEQLKNDKWCSLIPNLSIDTVERVRQATIAKINKGLLNLKNQKYYHTGPHHDDIMLGLFPHIVHELRDASNNFNFAILTSGFTAVTNSFLSGCLENTLNFINNGQIQMLNYKNFFTSGFKLKRDKDVYHFLDKVATGETEQQQRALSHRIVRDMVEIYNLKNTKTLIEKIVQIIDILQKSYEGEKNPPDIQKLKGMIREFEEELVWAHFGVQVKNIKHLRLGFYTGDIFTEQPDRKRDVMPILNELKQIKPTIISLALDPEASGPDTHYKVLQAIAEAIRLWNKEEDLSTLKIIGYRNVWFRFHPAEVNTMIPVSLNSMASLENAFSNCYLSQVNASFPSHMLDGKFSTLTKNIWIDQMKQIQLLLGKDFFYQNAHPRIRACHGMLFFKDMNVNEFLSHARKLEKSIEGKL